MPPNNPLDRVMRVVIVIVVLVALAALVWVGVRVFKNRYDRAVIDVYVREQNVLVENVTAVANETMAVEEAADTATIAVQDREIRDAQKPLPKVVPNGPTARQRRACVIMRQQGQDLDTVPACRGIAR